MRNTRNEERLTKRMTIYFDEQTWDRLTYLAELESRSKNNLIFTLVNKKMEEILNMKEEGLNND